MNGFAEANRLIAAYGPAMPKIHNMNLLQRWNGCRASTQKNAACGTDCGDVADECGRHKRGAMRFYPAYPIGDTKEPIYFVAGAGRVKIGKGPYRRARAHQTSSPVKLSVLRLVDVQEGGEKALHSIFADERLHGEWFRLTKRLRRLIFGFSDEQVRQAIQRRLFYSMRELPPWLEWHVQIRKHQEMPNAFGHPATYFCRDILTHGIGGSSMVDVYGIRERLTELGYVNDGFGMYWPDNGPREKAVQAVAQERDGALAEIFRIQQLRADRSKHVLREARQAA